MKKPFTIFFLLIAVSGWCVGSSTIDFGGSEFRTGNPRMCFVNNGTYSPWAAGWQHATFTTKISDTHSMHDGTGTATVRVSGNYTISVVFHAYGSGAAWYGYLRVQKNSADTLTGAYGFTFSGGDSVENGGTITLHGVPLAVGDTISVLTLRSGGSAGFYYPQAFSMYMEP